MQESRNGPKGAPSPVLLERTPGLALRALDAIRELIVDGSFAPGGRLNEVDLAEALGISRAPVREALHRLASEGLVELVPHRGAFVRRFSGDELHELYEVREALETTAARLAATRATPEDIKALFKLLQSTDSALSSKQDPSYPMDLDFHRMVLNGSRNSYLIKCGGEVQIAVNLARARSGSTPRRAQTALAEHRQIATAIKKGDPAAAAEAMRVHLQHSYDHAHELLPSQE